MGGHMKYGKKCSNASCKEKTYWQRGECFKCKPMQKGGRKYLGQRKSYLAKLTQKQQMILESHYDGSIQVLVNEVLDWKKKALIKKSS